MNLRILIATTMLALGALTMVGLSQDPGKSEIKAPGFEGGRAWINVEGELKIEQLRGKIVLLDFWTFC